MSMMKAIVAAGAFALAPLAASAITLEPDSYGVETFTLGANATKTLEFTPTAPLSVEFVIAATGKTAGDLGTVKFGTTYSAEKDLWTWSTPKLAYGAGEIDFASVEDMFSFFVTTGETKNPIGFTVSWTTESPAPVPLPAAGLLLGAALLGMGGVAAKRRRKAAEV
ncbi:hypothetical protein QCN27_16610 [Cereibacter sp. SYSU M97828]|nr:hypothetical protein [Cereibacter flavus]